MTESTMTIARLIGLLQAELAAGGDRTIQLQVCTKDRHAYQGIDDFQLMQDPNYDSVLTFIASGPGLDGM